jgi:hypothetical protein
MDVSPDQIHTDEKRKQLGIQPKLSSSSPRSISQWQLQISSKLQHLEFKSTRNDVSCNPDWSQAEKITRDEVGFDNCTWNAGTEQE